MRVLQISHKPPLPLIDGGCIAINHITELLLRNKYKVKVLTLSTPKHPFMSNTFSESYIQNTAIESCFIDTSLNWFSAFKNLLKNQSYNVSRFYSNKFSNLISKTLQNQPYDIIILESIFVAPYIDTIRKNSDAKIILRAHNIEHQLWEIQAKFCKNNLKKGYLTVLAKQLKSFEIDVFKSVDGILSITQNDTNTIQIYPNTSSLLLPFGIEIPKIELIDKPKTNTLKLFFIGSMDWSPNIESVDWFLDNIWNELLEKHPSLEFHLAGKAMPKKYFEKKLKNFYCHGEVNNAQDFMVKYDVLVAPVFSGGGVKIKILEAMAMQKLVVTTAFGIAGLDVKDKKHVLLIDSKQSIFNIVDNLLTNFQQFEEITQNAFRYLTDNHNNHILAEKLNQYLESLS